MKITVVSGAPEARSADLLAYAVFSDAAPRPVGRSGKTKAKKTASATARDAFFSLAASFSPALHAADVALGGLLSRTGYTEGFKGNAGQSFLFHTHGKTAARRILLVGLGPSDKSGPDTFRKFAAIAQKTGEKVKAKKITLVIPDEGALRLDARVQALVEGALLSAYRFDRYISKDRTSSSVEAFDLAVPERAHLDDAIARARAVVDGVCLARDLVNEPAGTLTPVEFALRAVAAGRKYKFKVEVLDERAIAREKMGLIQAVAKAASPYTPPRVVRLEYRPKRKAKKHIALVGKGLTFDCGGLDIKPTDGMLNMKVDMSGAAAVLGTMVAIAQLGVDVAVTGYLACVENGIGGNAYHPGDILISRKGLSIEINNTDAEGRLVLADCIDLCLERDKPDVLVDLATLTGACMVALGPSTAGVFTDDDELAEDIKTIGRRAGEDFWRLPLNDELLSQLKSPIADFKNTGLRYGGAITAALFLKQFVDGRATWAHLDIAGPASTDKDGEYTLKGGVGFGVRTLVGLIDPR